jgi:hypothetical protein
MSEFKFELGAFVVHVTERHHANMMVVLSRYFEEFPTYKEEKYVVSRLEMGQLQRTIMLADELIATTKKK